jgi:hypothetical protein
MRTRRRALIGLGAVTAGAVALPAAATPAHAANSPTFRDCSAFVEGFDPDFVEISGVTVTPGGELTVPPSQNSVVVAASESSDPGDSANTATLTVTVSSPGRATQVLSGTAVDRVFLTVPLHGSGAGRTYTIGWSATFDNGFHACPSAETPDNTAPNPFVVTVD